MFYVDVDFHKRFSQVFALNSETTEVVEERVEWTTMRCESSSSKYPCFHKKYRDQVANTRRISKRHTQVRKTD